MDAKTAWIGLGGNLGRVQACFEKARRAIAELSLTPLVCSPLYQSPPWGPVAQPPYVNQVIGCQPTLTPRPFMARLFEIETMLGRDRTAEVRWGPRVLDLDLLSWSGYIINTDELVLPHPRLHRSKLPELRGPRHG